MQINLYKIQGDDFINTDNTKRIASLVAEIQNGNKKAFDELYNLTNQRAYYVALEFVKKDEDAQDILQESYIKALSKIKELDKPESFQSWLNQIVANKSKDFLKKKKPMLFEAEENEVYEVLPDEDLNFRPENSLDQSELQRTVMEVLDELNEEKRACVLMMYFEELSVSEIARTLEIPEGTVKTRLFSARKDLKEKFSKRGITSAYSVAPIGVVLWAMRKSCITAGAAFASSTGSATVLAGITATTAASASVASTVTAAGTATAKTAGGIGAKIAAMSLAKKVVAGVAAVAVITGATVGGVTVAKNNKKTDKPKEQHVIITELQNSEVDSEYEKYIENKDFTPGVKYVDGYYTYVLDERGYAEIIRCNPSISGDVVLPTELDGYKVIGIGSPEPEVTRTYNSLADSITNISAFENCIDVTSVTIPKTYTHADNLSFAGCLNLQKIIVDKDNPTYSSDEFGVWYTKDKSWLIAFPRGSALTEFNIPDSVTKISFYAFLECPNLKKIRLSDNLKSVSYHSFVCCHFETFIIPEGVTRIGDQAFISCYINNLYLPKSINELYTESFYNINYNCNLYYAGTEEQLLRIPVYKQEELLVGSTIKDLRLTRITPNTPAPY